MAEKFIIKGGKKIEGEVEIKGYKNAAGPILASTLLTEEDCIIDNLPLVTDVLSLINILEKMGAEIEWLGERKIKINTRKVNPEKLDFEEISKSRVSVLLIGPLLARFKNFKISSPGGDRIGLRPIFTHLDALKKLGAEISQEGNFYHFKAKNLFAKEIILKEFSVTATENLMLTASLIEGQTIIKMAAAEPQVQDTERILEAMGVKIEGLGTHTLKIEGAKKLKGVNHQIISDPLEAGTFMIAGAIIPNSQLKIKKVIFEHLDSFLDKMEEIGVDFQKNPDNSLTVNYSPDLKAVKIQALPYPGFPTDLLSIIVPLLTQTQGKNLIHDPLYENRLGYTQELRKMGADIEIVDPHRAFVFGKNPLRGVKIESWDIRAGASLIIAGLLAEGQTIVENIYQIDRGYEKIEQQFQKLGADIKRIN
ncbi:MAG: UDP-N-acetylglucosamine 1-carboxyvinyltransferase [Candidatus Nealsonbacteria bacterium]|nr:UDP-N-acetylglucosamine 1-carboxyvinyltransferase [Candidatus Nealsonbacteria bacterium]